MRAYEHIVTQNKNNTDLKRLNIVGKSFVGRTKTETDNFVW